MCWSNYIVTPIVLKKPLRVYKVGTLTTLGGFRSLYHNFVYFKSKAVPAVKINLEFIKYDTFSPLDKSRMHNAFCINEGYHSYLSKEIAEYRRNQCEEVGIFEIPAGSTIYVNYRYEEVVSTDIKYLGLLELQTLV